MQTEFRAGPTPTRVDIIGAMGGELNAPLRQNRKLPDRILIAAHQACDLGNLDVAARLLSTLERVIIHKRRKADPQQRRAMESMIAAYYRLWQLRLDGPVSQEPLGHMLSSHEDDNLEASGR